ncbi:RDD family protein [Lentibacillus sediminis]|uniref:RDD family protein n=1 Tax=Lentibacillus sediminis TaxID=1940529 RepID=UPI000C1BE28B|nr:RDD family protein [Lentibacillus sediminis]
MSEEVVEYQTAVQPGTQVYAGFWMRFWAYLTDLIIVGAVNGIILSPLVFIGDGEDVTLGFWTLSGILAGIVFYLYFLLMTRFFHQTLGKMIFGLKVIRRDGGPLSWSDLLFREVVGRFVHRVIPIFAAAYIVVAFTPEKQGLHDMIGKTRVVFAR